VRGQRTPARSFFAYSSGGDDEEEKAAQKEKLARQLLIAR